MKSFSVIQTSNLRDLQNIATAARSLWSPTEKLVFVRVADKNPKEVLAQYTEELRSLALLTRTHKVIIATSDSVIDELEKHGISIKYFLGTHPEEVSMGFKDRYAAKKKAKVQLRYAAVCKRCETIIEERIVAVPRADAEAEVLKFDSVSGMETSANQDQFSVIDVSRCCTIC